MLSVIEKNEDNKRIFSQLWFSALFMHHIVWCGVRVGARTVDATSSLMFEADKKWIFKLL